MTALQLGLLVELGDDKPVHEDDLFKVGRVNGFAGKEIALALEDMHTIGWIKWESVLGCSSWSITETGRKVLGS